MKLFYHFVFLFDFWVLLVLKSVGGADGLFLLVKELLERLFKLLNLSGILFNSLLQQRYDFVSVILVLCSRSLLSHCSLLHLIINLLYFSFYLLVLYFLLLSDWCVDCRLPG